MAGLVYWVTDVLPRIGFEIVELLVARGMYRRALGRIAILVALLSAVVPSDEAMPIRCWRFVC